MKAGETVTGGNPSLKIQQYKIQENITGKQTKTKDTVLSEAHINPDPIITPQNSGPRIFFVCASNSFIFQTVSQNCC